MSADLLRRMQADDARLRQTETKEVPGGIPGFTSFYAAGTWVPTLVGATIGGTFVYNAVTFGTWTRLGNTVLFRGRITITTVSVAPTGALRIGGLPIVSATTTAGFAGGAQFSYWGLFGLGGGVNTYLGGAIPSAVSYIDLYRSVDNNAFASQITGAIAAVATNTDLNFQGQYQV
jgi:hypothetical protein